MQFILRQVQGKTLSKLHKISYHVNSSKVFTMATFMLQEEPSSAKSFTGKQGKRDSLTTGHVIAPFVQEVTWVIGRRSCLIRGVQIIAVTVATPGQN